MGYNIEISINMRKETKFSEIENAIYCLAELYNCANIYSMTEEDGTLKIPRYNCIYVIHFLKQNFDNLVKFIKTVKKYKPSYIECVYEIEQFKLLYASPFYLQSINKELSKKYNEYIKSNKFSQDELSLIQELM